MDNVSLVLIRILGEPEKPGSIASTAGSSLGKTPTLWRERAFLDLDDKENEERDGKVSALRSTLLPPCALGSVLGVGEVET